MNPEELLAHADFVHALARRLVPDPNSADDIAQQTWLAALEHPPLDGNSRTAWFSKVVRNFTRVLHRGERRRKAREKKAANPSLSPSPEEITERLETRRKLIDAVQDLDEPYRTAIVLRYYEDHPPREIAKKLGVPTETVRTRLKRGIERLRVRLDKAYGNDRGAWCLALAPLAGLKLKATASAGTVAATITGASTLATGALIMSAKIKIGLAALVILTSTFAFWQLLPEGDPNIDADPRLAKPEARVIADISGSEKDPKPTLPEKERIEPVASTEQSDLPPADPKCALRVAGRVIDEKTGKPVNVFRFNLLLNRGNDAEKVKIDETVRDSTGTFSFPIEHTGEGRIRIVTASHLFKEVPIRVQEAPGLLDLVIQLDSGYSACGRVVDDETSEPIENAIVREVPRLHSDHDVYCIRNGEETCCHHALTDEDGLFKLSALDEGNYNDIGLRGKWQLAALHPDYVEGIIVTKAIEGSDLEIRLHRGACIFGKALDDEGRATPNIRISTVGKEMPVTRDVVTDANGCYRTAPLPPGRIILNASPLEEAAEIVPFSQERKWTDIRDQDVEVNFGPSPQQITWKGTFYDARGEPVPKGSVVLRPVPFTFAESYQYDMRITAECDEGGRFLFHKLLPGSYIVTLDGAFQFDWGKITLEVPGELTRDLRVSGGSIKGIVINGTTGLPLMHEGNVNFGSVSTDIVTPTFRSFSADIDERSGFQLFGLPAGTYRLSAAIDGFPMILLEGVKVDEGKVTDNVVIKVYRGGKLKLKLMGFTAPEARTFKMTVKPLGSDYNYYRPDYHIGSSGEWEYEKTLEPGTWSLMLAFAQLGSVERTFDIVQGIDTQIVVHREEVVPCQGSVTVAGTLVYTDGSPVESATLGFYSSDAPGVPKEERSKRGKTDADGRFSIQGFKPGTWAVQAYLPTGGGPVFPDLVIPPDPANPYPLNLVVPAGEVTGSLTDNRTGCRFEDEGPKWWIFLRDVEDEGIVSQLQGGHTGPRFTLTGVPAGTFQLIIHARGYKEFETSAFSVGKGRSRDVGEIRLEPCGVLNLEVVDVTGEHIKKFDLRCDGAVLYDYLTIPLGPGINQYDQLPLGKLTLVIVAEGFKTQEKTVNLEPGNPLDLRVELKPEPLH